jgi:hypothetical protein
MARSGPRNSQKVLLGPPDYTGGLDQANTNAAESLSTLQCPGAAELHRSSLPSCFDKLTKPKNPDCLL